PVCVRCSRRISNSPSKPVRARLRTRSAFSPSTWAAASRLPSPWSGAGSKRDDESSVHARGSRPLWISSPRSEEKREMVRARVGAKKGIRIRKRRCYWQRQRDDSAVQRQAVARNNRSHVVSSAEHGDVAKSTQSSEEHRGRSGRSRR